MSEVTTHPAADLPVFDLDGDLPWGRLAIEASAGTGKTYTLCQLTVRYIAEAGIPASGFLIVTFTRAATAELRGRIRAAITERAEELRSGTADPMPADAERQLRNLEQAITEYDSITITTIHSFATQTIAALGATSRFDPPSSFKSDDTDTLRSACSDAIVRAVGNGVDPALLPKVGDLQRAVDTAVNTPDILIEPDEPEGEPTVHSVLAALVRDVMAMLRLRRATNGEVSFDDVLTALRDTVESPEGALLVESLRDRYRMVMIDEFQDTDPIQWAIFGTIFAEREDAGRTTGDNTTALILVGDPKQSIYSFRGADISTYSRATAVAGTTRVALGTNWRSDGQLLAGLETLLSGTTYGPGISFVPVKPAPKFADRYALDGGTPIVPVRARLALGDGLRRTSRGIQAGAARNAVWNDLVCEVHRTLASVELPDGDSGRFRPVDPSDIAVLVRTGKEALDVQERLIRSGVPAVLSRAGKVLESPAAEQWRWLLDALGRPSDSQRARRFALSWFTDLDVSAVDRADDATMSALFEQLRSWVETLRRSGVAEFVQRVVDDSGVVPRMLRRLDGDRAVTDLLHIGELLQTDSDDHQPTIANLLNLLQPGANDAGVEDTDEYARRVETQDKAVQIMTIWVSKGLEFPIVMVPTLFTAFGRDPDVVFNDADGQRVFDVSGKDADPERINKARSRQIEENLRLLYVALTRASHQVTIWWATPNSSEKSPLSRVLFGRDEDGSIDPSQYAAEKLAATPKDAAGATQLDGLVRAGEGRIEVTVIDDPGRPASRWSPTVGTAPGDGDAPELRAATLDKLPDRSRGRWSFTAITSAEATRANPEDVTLGDAGAGDEHQTSEDSPGIAQDGATDTADTDTSRIPLGWLPAGAALGTLVHSVYEKVDFTDPDPEGAIRTALTDELSWRSIDLTPPLVENSSHAGGLTLLTSGIARTLTTPLGPLFGDRTLASIGRSDRLSELSFELLLGADRASVGPAGGRATTRAVLTDRDIGAVLSRWIGSDEPLSVWAEQLEAGRFGVDLGGHLTGSIDAVFRIEREGLPRFVVCDYKTNRLSGFRETPAPEQYGPNEMTEAMVHHHYPLQALLYSVALHRYLRSRLSDYDPEVHLGGVAYLFVRGMVGAGTPVIDGSPTGVWSWHPPAGLVVELSELLAGVRDGQEAAP